LRLVLVVLVVVVVQTQPPQEMVILQALLQAKEIMEQPVQVITDTVVEVAVLMRQVLVLMVETEQRQALRAQV
jgi:hypothetical protein